MGAAALRPLIARDRKYRIALDVIVQFVFWGFLFGSRGSYTGPVSVASWCIAVLVYIFVLTQSGILLGVFETVLNIELTFSVLLALFSTLYWNYGSAANFSVTLTRLDAVYFAIGTLTTAGTGNISPISQTARGIQSLQMLLDLVLIVFAVTLVLSALSSRPRKAENP